MHVFVINLDKDTERMRLIAQRLNTLGIPYERISGIDAQKMSYSQKQGAVDQFRFWCVVGRRIREGEIGCALSHKYVYQLMQRRNLAVACILEDDVILSDKLLAALCHVEEKIKTGVPQVCLLSNHTKHKESCALFQIRPIKHDLYAEGYVLNIKAAKLLSKINLPMTAPCDWWGRWVRLYGLELVHIVPAVCTQEQSRFVSNTGGGGIL